MTSFYTRTSRPFVLLLSLALAFINCVNADFAEVYQRYNNAASDEVMVVAHRADWRNHPENSLSSIQSCIDNGVDVLELDIRKTSDGVMILMHDSTVSRTTNGTGSVSSMTLAQIRALRLLHNGEVTTEQVPTLEEAMLLAKNHCMVYLDKTYPNALAETIAVLQSTGTVDNGIWRATGSAQSVVTTYTNAGIDPTKVNIAFRVVCAGTTSPSVATIMSELAIVNPGSLQVNYDNAAHPIFDAANIAAIRALGTRIFVNTMHDGRVHKDPNPGAQPTDWDWLVDHGVTVIETDRPLWLVDYVTGRVFDAKPLDGSSQVSVGQDLTWKRGYGATSHDIYLGANLTSVSAADTSSVEFLGNQAGDSYSPATPLLGTKTYYWRVDEHTLGGVISGDVMAFTTSAPPVYPSSDLPVTSGLKMHLDAGNITGLSDQNPVPLWLDASGSKNDAEQGLMGVDLPVYVSDGINGLPVVRFDGSNDSMRANLSVPIAVNNMTLFTVAAGAGKYVVTTQENVNTSNRFRLAIYNGNFGCRVGSDSYAYGSPTIAGDGDPHVRAIISGASSYQMYHDGVLQLTDSQTSSHPIQGFNLASYWDTVSSVKEWSSYDIAEVVVYDRVLSSSEIDQVNLHLQAKYGGSRDASIMKVRVMLVGGQSNADGRAAINELPISPVDLQAPQDDVDFFYKVEGGLSTLTSLRPGLSESSQFGPSVTLGRRLADLYAGEVNTRVAIIKYANGGTNLHTQWKGGGDNTLVEDGEEYVTFQQTVTQGAVSLAAVYPNADISFEAMTWMQGEADATSSHASS